MNCNYKPPILDYSDISLNVKISLTDALETINKQTEFSNYVRYREILEYMICEGLNEFGIKIQIPLTLIFNKFFTIKPHIKNKYYGEIYIK